MAPGSADLPPDLSAGRELRFFLSRSPDQGGAELGEGEHEHALRVLRLRAGDRLIGLDGKGAAWPLTVASVVRGKIALAEAGSPRRDPRPGDEGSPMPWIEVAVPWPKGGRAEEMLDRLTQLGVAAVGALACERAGPSAAQITENRRERFDRVMRESCKQCGRTWLPLVRDRIEIGPSATAGTTVILQRAAPTSLFRWARERVERGDAGWTASSPLRLLVGPEGGFTEEESASLRETGASPASLGPFVLRVETAAEAALAVLASAFLRSPGS